MPTLPNIPLHSPLSSSNPKTWKIDFTQERLSIPIWDKDALQQSLLLRLSTPRYRHTIYSFRYGSTLSQLIGQPFSAIVNQAPAMIQEILMQDSRVKEVKNFSFTDFDDSVSVSFVVVCDTDTLTLTSTI